MFTPCARPVTHQATRVFVDFGVLSAIVVASSTRSAGLQW
jgi:hypothetical protein